MCGKSKSEDRSLADQRKAQFDECLELILAMVSQFATFDAEDNSLCSGAISTIADAMRYLVKHGKLELVKDYGHRLVICKYAPRPHK
jgi:hypothetical protein